MPAQANMQALLKAIDAANYDEVSRVINAVEDPKADSSKRQEQRNAFLQTRLPGKSICPAHYAAQRGLVAIARFLTPFEVIAVDEAVAINVYEPQDQNGDTPWHYFALEGRVEAVEYLSPQLQEDFRKAYFDAKNHAGQTIFHIAAERGDFAFINALLAAKAHRSTFDNEGRSPLHLACAGGYLDCAKKIVEGRTWAEFFSSLVHEPGDYLINKKDWAGNTALHSAAQSGNVPLLAYLLKHGAELNATNSASETALNIAASKGHAEAARFLLAQGAAANAQRLRESLIEAHRSAVVSPAADSLAVRDTLTAVRMAALAQGQGAHPKRSIKVSPMG